jgi:hypothetical protein
VFAVCQCGVWSTRKSACGYCQLSANCRINLYRCLLSLARAHLFCLCPWLLLGSCASTVRPLVLCSPGPGLARSRSSLLSRSLNRSTRCGTGMRNTAKVKRFAPLDEEGELMRLSAALDRKPGLIRAAKLSSSNGKKAEYRTPSRQLHVALSVGTHQ